MSFMYMDKTAPIIILCFGYFLVTGYIAMQYAKQSPILQNYRWQVFFGGFFIMPLAWIMGFARWFLVKMGTEPEDINDDSLILGVLFLIVYVMAPIVVSLVDTKPAIAAHANQECVCHDHDLPFSI